MPQVYQFALGFRRHSGHFIPQPKIQGQVRPCAPIILNIAAEDVLAKISWRQGTGNATLELRRLILKKCRQVVEGPDSIRIGERSGLGQHALESEAKFDGMPGSVKECVVISLKGI